MKTYSKSKSGFTLIEILIVVIILGILAAIVIPQFTNASQDARKSSLASEVQTLKSQIELYKLQHKDIAPKLITTGWDVFLQYSDIDGNLNATQDLTTNPPKNLGPYMQSSQVNPLTGSDTFAAIGSPAAGVGWTYDESTGKIHGVISDSTNTTYYETDDGYHDLANNLIQ